MLPALLQAVRAFSVGVGAWSETMDDDIAYLGMRQVWGQELHFGLRPEDRRQHVYAIGQTGTGKSTLLRNLIIQDIHHGHGVGLIDPHGDLAHELLDCIPSWRANHVVYFNPADREYPIGLNLLWGNRDGEKHLITSGIVGSFKSIWRDSWGPRLEYLLYACIAALQECQNTSLLGVQRMLIDPLYRHWVVRQVNDPILKVFWLAEFASYDKRMLSEIVSPIQNKIGQLFMAPPLRNVLGQVRRKIDMRFMMDDRRIFIANLAKGKLGEDKANLLGSLLVTQFQLAAMSRSDIPADKRRPFLLYVDEFQNFATDSFATILSESRKFGLQLHLFHQYLGQLRPEVRDAIFGNVGTFVAFRVGEADGKIMEQQFGGSYMAQQFTSLENHHAYVRPMINGTPSQPFSLRSLAPLALSYGRAELLIRLSREKYGISRKVAEARIRRWLGEVPNPNRHRKQRR